MQLWRDAAKHCCKAPQKNKLVSRNWLCRTVLCVVYVE